MNYLVVTVGLFLKPINIQHLNTQKKNEQKTVEIESNI